MAALSRELLAEIRRIEIVTRKLVNQQMAGQYHSVFKGRGMSFDEVRAYLPGDDPRTIDWNVTARTGEPYVKTYVEERELTVLIMVDLSGSMAFGTVGDVPSPDGIFSAAEIFFTRSTLSHCPNAT